MQVDARDLGAKNVLPPARACLTQAGASGGKTFCHPRGATRDQSLEAATSTWYFFIQDGLPIKP